MRDSIILMGMDILQPVVALMIWTMIVWAWMYATRLPAMQKLNIDPESLKEGVANDLDRVLPPHVQWKAHNFNHLHEQPTVFYAVAILLAIVGHGDGMNALFAWAYVGLRVVHSVVQVTTTTVVVRFGIFVVSGVVLLALIFNTALIVFGTGTELQGAELV